MLDIAGGKGELAFELQAKRGVRAVLVEPREQRGLSRKQRNFAKKSARPLAQLVPRHVRARVDDDFLRGETTFLDDGTGGGGGATATVLRHAELLARCSALVGVHADEATEWIVDAAIAHDKPFCVIPCCVFPFVFAERVDPLTGERVVSHQQFVDYLSRKRYAGGKGEVKTTFLPFAGRNQVVYGTPYSHPPP